MGTEDTPNKPESISRIRGGGKFNPLCTNPQSTVFEPSSLEAPVPLRNLLAKTNFAWFSAELEIRVTKLHEARRADQPSGVHCGVLSTDELGQI
jgi:hypothetical protein